MLSRDFHSKTTVATWNHILLGEVKVLNTCHASQSHVKLFILKWQPDVNEKNARFSMQISPLQWFYLLQCTCYKLIYIPEQFFFNGIYSKDAMFFATEFTAETISFTFWKENSLKITAILKLGGRLTFQGRVNTFGSWWRDVQSSINENFLPSCFTCNG